MAIPNQWTDTHMTPTHIALTVFPIVLKGIPSTIAKPIPPPIAAVVAFLFTAS